MENNTITEQPKDQARLELKDLAAVVQIIDLCSRRGAFEGAELKDIGELRTRYVEFLKSSQPKQPQGTEAAPGGVETVPASELPKA